MEILIYKQLNGKTKGDWQLPLAEAFANKQSKDGEELGYRKLAYSPGSGTIWDEDLSKEAKRESIWFRNGELRVASNNIILNKILKTHGWFGIHYGIFNKNSEDKKVLDELRFKTSVTNLIDDAEEDKLKAIALAVFGRPAFNWGFDTCELELRKYADESPLKLKAELEHDNYESKYLAALAFNKNIVKHNIGKTLVVWNDSTEGIILRLSKGEQGVHKLGNYLSERTDESLSLLQEIGDRIEKLEISLQKTDPNKDLKAEKLKIQQEKEDLAKERLELESLRKQLQESKNGTLDIDVEETTELTLEQAREKYTELLGKVPNNKKNDTEWLLSKIKEAQ